MDAICICEGPFHVIVEVNGPMRDAAGFDPVGQPAREAFPGYSDLQRLMDVCYRTGNEQVVYLDDATWLVFKWQDAWGCGVATAHRPCPVAAALPLPQTPSVAA